MSTLPVRRSETNDYPTSDGKPMAETDRHRELMNELIATLKRFYCDQKRVYVSGNLLFFYEKGDKRKHISPDVMVVRGVANRERLNYLLWEEGKAPQFVIELTSSSTRREDTHKKYHLYQNVLKVKEYFLFDPFGDYLKPHRLLGYRLVKGAYTPITPVADRLPSRETGLHLEIAGNTLRLWNPATGAWVPTAIEERDQVVQERDQVAQERDQALAEAAQLRHQVEMLRQQLGTHPGNGG